MQTGIYPRNGSSSEVSIQPAFRSGRRRVFAGSKTWMPPQKDWVAQIAAYTLGTGKATARQAGTHFVFRICADRLYGSGKQRVSEPMQLFPAQGRHVLDVQDAKGQTREVRLSIRFQRLILCPPAGGQKRYDPIELTVIHPKEESRKSGGEGIDWKLATDLPVAHLEEDVEKLGWYAMRWKIETFHKILKSGCRAEDSKLRTASRLTNLPAIFCIPGWCRILADDDGTQRVCSFPVVRLHR